MQEVALQLSLVSRGQRAGGMVLAGQGNANRNARGGWWWAGLEFRVSFSGLSLVESRAGDHVARKLRKLQASDLAVRLESSGDTWASGQMFLQQPPLESRLSTLEPDVSSASSQGDVASLKSAWFVET